MKRAVPIDEMQAHLSAVVHWHGPCPNCLAQPKNCYGNHPFDAETRTAAPRLCGNGTAVCIAPPTKKKEPA